MYRAKRQRKKPEKRYRADMDYYNLDQDEDFYFIAGYTSGGAPYGITWEQARKDGLIEPDNEEDTDELPFD